MASYSEGFKRNAMDYLNELREKGKFQLNNIDITNIRELCVFLDVSSQTLYRWEKSFSILKSLKKDISDELSYIERIAKARESVDIQESESDLMKLHLGESNENSKQAGTSFFVPVIDEKKAKSTGEKVIFNQRYLGWMAGMLGIKYYSDMLIPQLKLAIGNELIKQSGLIDMNKASEKLSQNAINYIEKHGRL